MEAETKTQDGPGCKAGLAIESAVSASTPPHGALPAQRGDHHDDDV